MAKPGIMQLWRAYRKADPSIQQRAVAYLSNPDAWLQQLLTGGGDGAAGVTVNERTAMETSSVFAAVTKLAKIIASLPILLYRRLDNGGKDRAVDHPLYKVLHLKPNGEQTAFAFIEMLAGHALLYGDAYAQIERTAGGRVTALWPLLAWKMRPFRKNGQLIYEYTTEDERTVRFGRDKILHIPGFSFDGVSGIRPIKYMRDTLGVSIAVDQYGARFFANDSTPGGVLTTDQKISNDAYERMRSSWEKAHTFTNRHRIAILEQGLKFQEMMLSPDKAQFLETRKHQVTESARIFDLPPHMIGDLERATFTNIEHQGIEFLTFDLQPTLVRWEQAITVQLIPDTEIDQGYFVQFLVDALLRADINTRYSAYRTAREIGVMSANEIRSRENMNPIEGGDTYYIPLNWQDANNPVVLQEPDVEPESEEENSRAVRFPVRVDREYETRAALLRSRIAHSYRHVFKDAIDKVIKRERADIRKAIDEFLVGRSSTEFEIWMRGYYQKLPEDIQRRVTPVYQSIIESIRSEIEDELRKPIDADMDKLLKAYVDAYIKRYIYYSTDALMQNMHDIDALAATVDGWQAKRGAHEALSETTRSANAITRSLFIAAGITLFRWVAIGSETCDFCKQLDGKVVGKESTFVLEGSAVESESGKTLGVQRKVMHPPIHDGCVCMIAAEG